MKDACARAVRHIIHISPQRKHKTLKLKESTMLRILKYLSNSEIGQLLISLVTIVGQVYFDLELPSYMSEITRLVETPGSQMRDIWISVAHLARHHRRAGVLRP